MKPFVFIGLLFVLTACSTSSVPIQNPIATSIDYVATIDIDLNANEDEIAALYNAKIISFKPEAGFAILGLSEEQAKLSSLNTESNVNAMAAPPEGSGWNAWAGGWNAWAGGWNAWAGGWNAWAGGNGNLPKMPNNNRSKLRPIQLPHAHAISTEYGNNVVVAVLDTGVETNHPMFSGRLVYSSKWYDFVDNDPNPSEESTPSELDTSLHSQGLSLQEGGEIPNVQSYGHGTAVAGAILQVAPKAKIMPLRVLDADGLGDTDDVIEAIEWAVNKGADIINLSLGAKQDVMSLQTMVNYATARGVYVIASAGNTGGNLTFPAAKAKVAANHKRLISVGSINSSIQLSEFSSRGSGLEIVAPGEQIYSAYPGNETAHYNGTSFAAPLVSGTVALAMAELRARNASPEELNNIQTYLLAGSDSYTQFPYKSLRIPGVIKALPGYVPLKALLVSGQNNTYLNANDQAIKTRLQALGYTVTVRRDDIAKTSDAYDKDIVLISSTVDTAEVHYRYKNVAVPVVVMHYGMYKKMGMTGSVLTQDYGSGAGDHDINYKTTDHPLNAGFSGVKEPLTYAFVKMPWGKPNSNAITIASPVRHHQDKFAIFAYEKGSSMVGLTAPARRVAFPSFTGLSGSFDSPGSIVFLSFDGRDLFDAMVNWAVSGN